MAVNGMGSAVPDAAALLASMDALFAKQSNNLSDLDSAATARTNLGLGSSATQTAAQLAADSSFTSAFQALGVTARRTVAMGDSITAGAPGANYFDHMCWTSGGRFFRVANYGVAGDTTEGMLARWDSTVATASPEVVFILAGANNLDDPDYDRSVYVARIAEMCTRTRALGATPVVLSLIPNTAQRARVVLFNRALRNACALLQVRYVDVYTPLVDPATGTFLSGYSDDGVHPTAAAYKVMAATVNAACADLGAPVPWLPGENADSANLLTNPLFLTDSNADGLANNWSIVNNIAGVVRSLVTGDSAIKGSWQKAVMTTVTADYSTTQQTVASGFADGDRVLLVARVKVSALSGTSPVWKFGYIRGAGSTYENVVQDSKADGDLIIEHEFTVPSGTTTLGVFWQIRSSSGSSSGTIEVAQAGLYNLTTAGSLS